MTRPRVGPQLARANDLSVSRMFPMFLIRTRTDCKERNTAPLQCSWDAFAFMDGGYRYLSEVKLGQKASRFGRQPQFNDGDMSPEYKIRASILIPELNFVCSTALHSLVRKATERGKLISTEFAI